MRIDSQMTTASHSRPALPPLTRGASRMAKVEHKQYEHLSNAVSRISFLWEAYEPQFWFWEVVETTRRLVLTAILSVLGTGTTPQAVLACLLGLLYIKLYGYYEPYDNDNDDVVAEVGQFQIFFTFFGALIYQRDLLGSAYNVYVGLALMLLNLTVGVLFFYFEFLGLLEEKGECDEEGRMLRGEGDEEEGEGGEGGEGGGNLAPVAHHPDLHDASEERGVKMSHPPAPHTTDPTDAEEESRSSPETFHSVFSHRSFS